MSLVVITGPFCTVFYASYMPRRRGLEVVINGIIRGFCTVLQSFARLCGGVKRVEEGGVDDGVRVEQVYT